MFKGLDLSNPNQNQTSGIGSGFANLQALSRKRAEEQERAEQARKLRKFNKDIADFEQRTEDVRNMTPVERRQDFLNRSAISTKNVQSVQNPYTEEEMRQMKYKREADAYQASIAYQKAQLANAEREYDIVKKKNFRYYDSKSIPGGLAAYEETKRKQKEDADAKKQREIEAAKKTWTNQFGPASIYDGAHIVYTYGDEVRYLDDETGLLNTTNEVTSYKLVDDDNPEYKNWMNMTQAERIEARNLGTWGDLEAREEARILRRDGPPLTAKQKCEQREGVKVFGFGPFPYEYTKGGNCINTAWYWL